MTRKPILLIALLVCLSIISRAQTFKLNVNRDGSAVRSVTVGRGATALRVSLSGEVKIDGRDNFTTADYYYPADGRDLAGKIRSLGNVQVTYYDVFGGFDNVGKVKSIGGITFEYYTRFDGFDDTGRLKSIGGLKVTYYTRFDGFDNIGKLKSVGNTTITYYDRFNTGDGIGRIRSIAGDTRFDLGE